MWLVTPHVTKFIILSRPDLRTMRAWWRTTYYRQAVQAKGMGGPVGFTHLYQYNACTAHNLQGIWHFISCNYVIPHKFSTVPQISSRFHSSSYPIHIQLLHPLLYQKNTMEPLWNSRDLQIQKGHDQNTMPTSIQNSKMTSRKQTWR